METTITTGNLKMRFASYKELLKDFEIRLVEEQNIKFEESGEYLDLTTDKDGVIYNNAMETMIKHGYKFICVQILMGKLDMLFKRPEIYTVD